MVRSYAKKKIQVWREERKGEEREQREEEQRERGGRQETERRGAMRRGEVEKKGGSEKELEKGDSELELKELLRERILQEINSRSRMEDEELLACIDSLLLEEVRECYLPLESKIRLKKELFDRFRRLGLLQELVDDKEVSEIMVNGAKDIFIERGGKASRWNKEFEDEGQLEDLIQKIVSRVNRIVNRSAPICDARLEDGSRIHIVLPPVALNGPVLTIRKFPKVLSMKNLIENETLTKEAALFLEVLVQAGYNIFVSGGTGCGKTTFLNALSEFIPQNSRVITIEDAAELQIRHVENLVRMETRNQNIEGEGEISMGQLIKAALRMNPDRILIGEVRGKEAMDMLAAMNTGHDGSLSTGHANGPADMLHRLESMVLMGAELPLAAIRSQIASALDILVHIGRLRDKSRRVLSIMEVMGIEEGEIQLSPLFTFQETRKTKKGEKVEGRLFQMGELCHREKLDAAGDLL